jgi:CheY-like chemotaxis protein
VASFASEALGLLRAQRPVPGERWIAILDAHLPDADALALGGTIRALPGLQEVGLLLLTNIGQRGDSKRAVEAGFNAYLTKPINPTDLHDALATLVAAPAAAPQALITRHSMAEARGHISSGSRRRLAVQLVANQATSPKVLVVEDNAVNCRVVSRILERLGCEVVTTASGSEAIDLCLDGGFALVLMDYHLPGLDGASAVRAIRAREQGRRVPIMAMSASVLDQDRALFKECGMDGLITKPIRGEDIEAALARVVGGDLRGATPSGAPDPQR